DQTTIQSILCHDIIFAITDAEEVKSCCTNVSAAEVIDPIISFRMQRESLPCVKAVIFETEQGERKIPKKKTNYFSGMHSLNRHCKKEK
uniref:Chemokine (C-C motif) ligand 34b, duplicate 1 n=1 Tax=Sinocyclocheilus rhinocerous TaxID=307959 RepID=A0A673N0P3_9TELE